MSLRRSPRRTAAFLAANRANAQKSTGPRTALGKQASAANGFRARTAPDLWQLSLLPRNLDEVLAGRPIPPEVVLFNHPVRERWEARSEIVREIRRVRERLLRWRRREARRRQEVKG